MESIRTSKEILKEWVEAHMTPHTDWTGTRIETKYKCESLEEFVPPCKFKDGDILAYTSSHTTVFIYRNKDNEPKHTTSFYVSYTIGGKCYCNFNIYNKSTLIALNGDCDTRLATEEEKEKLFKAIKDNGYCWNPETKNLEKLIEPKFKVGDRIRLKNGGSIIEVTSVNNDGSICVNGMSWTIKIKQQDNYELVPNKFDINTLVPFESKVLVRDTDHYEWEGAVFGRYDGNSFFTIGGIDWKYCIPYEGNEYLFGKTDDCNEYYKNWK